jgi:argininosuccinate synthase
MMTKLNGSKDKVNKVVLAYSGGLDTSVILPWLIETYGCEVVCYTADVGQGAELSGLEEKAFACGASKIIIEDLQEQFASDYLFPYIRSGAVYEGKYLLGTSVARPLIAKRQAEIALQEGADGLAHGCTGKGNDQVRFELTFMSVAPNLKVIAPWREWSISSREDALDYASVHNIPVTNTIKSIYSRDGNLWHLSHEGGVLEDPWAEPEEEMFQMSSSPENAPDKAQMVEIEFVTGYPVALNGEKLSPANMIKALNQIGSLHGIGRVDLVENRLVGMKSRGVYETPGGTILMAAHKELESITLDRDTSHYKELIASKYAELVYNGLWFTPSQSCPGCFY